MQCKKCSPHPIGTTRSSVETIKYAGSRHLYSAGHPSPTPDIMKGSLPSKSSRRGSVLKLPADMAEITVELADELD